jgi:hypothetical protein
MAENYYGEEAGAAEAPEKESMPEGEGMAEGEDTFLAPKYAFGSECKVGDKYTVEVVSVMEDELELKKVSSDKSDKKEESEMDETEMGLRELEG